MSRRFIFTLLTCLMMCVAVYKVVTEHAESVDKYKEAKSINKDVELGSVPAADSGESKNTVFPPQVVDSSVATSNRISEKLMRDFDQSNDYRVLLQSLFQRSAEGARIYAIAILSICARVSEKAADLSQPATSREQEAARQLLNSRCGTLSALETDNSYIYSVMKDRRLLNDPLSNLQNDLDRASQNKDTEKRMSLLEKILETQDPILLERAGLFAAGSDGVLRFDGDPLTDKDSPSVLVITVRTATCSTGRDCGSRDPDVLNYCAFTNQCFPDRQTLNRDQVLKNYGENGLRLYDQVLPKIESALRDKDPSIFR